jgi:hypothetical protein
MNSSLSISPGWVVIRRIIASSVTVHDFDIVRPFIGPAKANSPLLVDPYTELLQPIPFQGF